MIEIYLIHLFDRFSVGGISSFTNHLYLQMETLGYSPAIVKRKTVEKFQSKEALPTKYLSDDEIIEICTSSACIITFCSWAENRTLVKQLIRLGVPIVVHDPVEYYSEMLDLASQCSGIITIRKKNTINLLERGYVSTFIRHPYVRAGIDFNSKAGAVTCTRVTYNKCPSIIIKANEMGSRIDMYGELNRDYYFEHLQKTSTWKKYYKGEIENRIHAVPKVLSKYLYSIDLTTITLDGGGTQYSFLESWDAGCMLIVHDKWILEDDDLVPGLNCLTARDEYTLHELISSKKKYDIAIHSTILEKHNEQNSGKKFVEYVLLQNEIRKSSHTD